MLVSERLQGAGWLLEACRSDSRFEAVSTRVLEKYIYS